MHSKVRDIIMLIKRPFYRYISVKVRNTKFDQNLFISRVTLYTTLKTDTAKLIEFREVMQNALQINSLSCATRGRVS